MPVDLAELVAEPDRLDGALVVVEGWVRRHDEPAHVWIEDQRQHRVELLPTELGDGYVGQQVRIRGRFTAPGDRGRRIEVELIEPRGEPPSARSPDLDGSVHAGAVVAAAAREAPELPGPGPLRGEGEGHGDGLSGLHVDGGDRGARQPRT